MDDQASLEDPDAVAADDDELDAYGRPIDDPVAVEVLKHPWHGVLALVLFVGLVVAANVGSALSANWANHHPALLLAMSARNRHLLLVVANDISPVSYAAVATLRLLAAALVCYLIGRAYGDRALKWFLRFLGLTPDSLDRFQKGFETAQWVLIPVFVGSNIVCVLTGVHKTPLRKFVPLLLLGIAVRLPLLWWLGKQFESQLDTVLRFMQRWQWPLVIASVVFIVAVNARNFRRGKQYR